MVPKVQPNIIHSTVDFGTRTIQVIFKKKKLKLSELAYFLNSLGYKPILSLDSVEKKGWYLFFANTMLLAFPEYLWENEDLWLEKKQHFFHLLMFFLSFPVIFYSAPDFLKTALTGFGSVYFDSLSGLVFFMLLVRVFQMITSRYLAFDRDSK